MCFSLEVSVGTGLFCWAVGFYLLRRNLTRDQRMKVYFLLIFSSIQFADAILWYIKMEPTNINYLVTSYVIPIILSSMILFNTYIRHRTDNRLLDVVVIAAIFGIFRRFRRVGYSSSSSCDKLSSPVWGRNELELWEIILFLFLITYPEIDGLLITNILIVLLILNNFGGGYGSLWCAIACIFSLKYLYEF